MDCCCLNRPADDQTQDKIRIETDAIMGILFKCFYGSWELIGSDIIEYEIMKTPDLNKQDKALNLYSVKKENIELRHEIETRASEVQKYGLKPLDGLHFASAEYKNVDILLTVDNDFMSLPGAELRSILSVASFGEGSFDRKFIIPSGLIPNFVSVALFEPEQSSGVLNQTPE